MGRHPGYSSGVDFRGSFIKWYSAILQFINHVRGRGWLSCLSRLLTNGHLRVVKLPGLAPTYQIPLVYLSAGMGKSSCDIMMKYYNITSCQKCDYVIVQFYS